MAQEEIKKHVTIFEAGGGLAILTLLTIPEGGIVHYRMGGTELKDAVEAAFPTPKEARVGYEMSRRNLERKYGDRVIYRGPVLYG